MIRWLVLVPASVLLVVAAILVYLANADLGRFKNQLAPLASHALGRELRVEGDLSLRLGRTVTLRAADVSVANAPWADGPYLLQSAGLEARVDLGSLIRGPVRIESVVLQDTVIRLQEAEDGRRNWLPGETAASEDAGPTAADPFDVLRGLGSFSASDVRVKYSAPHLSAANRVVIGTADYSVKGGLMTANLDAEINGIPLALAAGVAPASDAAAALRIEADARMGEVVLKASALLADLEALAVSAANFELDGPDMDYVFDVLNLPELTSGPLSVRANLTPGRYRAAFDTEGQLGEYRFEADGWVEDLRGAGGFDIAVRVAVANLALIGRRLAVGDLPAVPFEVDGNFRGAGGRLEFDDTRITVGEEEARVQGTLARAAAGAMELDVAALYRGMSSRATLAIPARGSRDGLGFELSVEGEDAGEPARHLGLDHLAGLPFVLNADGSYGDRTVAFRQARVRTGTQELTLTGQAGFSAGAPDVELRFDAAGIDVSPWLEKGPLDPALRTVSGSGRVTVSGGVVTADELAFRAGTVSLAGRVSFPLSQGAESGGFALHLQAPSAAAVVPGLARGLPAAVPLELRGEGGWQPGGWQLDDLVLKITDRGDLRAGIDFTAGAPPAIDARLTADRLDLRPAVEAARKAAPQPDTAAAAADEHERVIPDWEIPLARLPDLEAQLYVEIGALYGLGLGGEAVLLDAALRGGGLIVEGLETTGPRGRTRTTLFVEPDPAGSYVAALELGARDLYLALPDEPAASLPDRPSLDMTATLQARGGTLREMAAGLEGRLQLQMEAGTIRRRGGVLVTLIFEDFLSRTLATINPLSKTREQEELNCLVLIANIEAGTVRGNPMLALQTSEVNLLTRGRIDLGSESLNLDIVTQPRRGLGISLGDLINPFTRIGGTLAHPRLVADPKSAALATGAGIATGGISVFAKKLRERFLAGDPCVKALEQDQSEAGR